MTEQGLKQLRQSKFSEVNVSIQPQKTKQTFGSNKEFENENMAKSSTKLPPLKKPKQDDNIDQKSINFPPPSNLQRKQTDPGDRKYVTSNQNSYVIKKFNSKRRISKKKETNEDFRPQILNKYNQYLNFLTYVNISNNLKVSNAKYETRFVLYVGKGNNGSLIKYIFRNWRPWWTIEEHDPTNPSINLHWYQLRQNSILDQFGSANFSFEDTSEYLMEDLVESKTEKKDVSIRSNSRSSKKQIPQNRSQSLIQRDSISFSKTVNYKRSTSKTKAINQGTQKSGRLSPVPHKTNLKEAKEDAIEQENIKSHKKNLTNPKMWPVYAMYRRIFSSHDMKKLKKMGVFQENGSMKGKISRAHMKMFQNRSQKIVMHNHLESNWNLSNKKALFMNMKNYYEAKKMNPFQYIPMTFHIQQIGDKQYDNFVEEYHKRSQQILQDEKAPKKPQYKSAFKAKKRNAWLIKPGENSNRGNGIEVVESLEEIKEKISSEPVDPMGRPRTHIVQEYILPFLYQKRKFDIRTYILVTSVNGQQKGYWYQDGYIRTASKEFNMKNLANKMIHLTNDAVQKKCEDYGKYEPGNKLSYADFQRYLDSTYNNSETPVKLKFWQQAYPQMKKLAADAIRAVYTKMDSSKKQFSFEIFGLDFLIDENFKMWLIEANTNPCLELSSPLLGRLIPAMLQNAFKIAIDPLFPPPPLSELSKLTKKIVLPENSIQNNKFELVFDEAQQGAELKGLLTNAPQIKIYDIEQEQDEYDEDYEQEEETREMKDSTQGYTSEQMTCSQKI